MNEINHPDYYGGEDNPFECIKVIENWNLEQNLYLGTAVKYISRAGKKEGNTLNKDLNKAIWYIERFKQSKKNFAKGVNENPKSPADVAENWGLSPNLRAALTAIAMYQYDILKDVNIGLLNVAIINLKNELDEKRNAK